MAGTASTIRVLHVDDDTDLAAVTADFLEREDDRIETVTAASASAALSYVEDNPVDCIVSDHDMPGMNGLEFLDAVRAEYPDLPFILFTGKGSEEIASEAISAGVSDYLQKKPGTEQYELLANRIGNAVEQHRAASAVERTEQRLRELTENANDALWMYSGDWEEIGFINSAYEDIWGQSVERLREDPSAFVEAVHPEDRDRVREAAERVSAGKSIDLEFRVNEAADYGRWAWVKAEPVLEEDSAGTGEAEVARVVGFTRDVTDRKRRERMLRELNRATGRLIESDDERSVAEVAVETARDGLGVSSARCWFADGDELALAAATDVDQDAVAPVRSGTLWSVFDGGESRVRNAIDAGSERLDAGVATESELLVPVGDAGVLRLGSADADAFGDVAVSLAQALAGNVASALGRVRREADLREEQAFTQAALDALDETFYVFDDEGRLVRWNDELSAVTGYDEATMVEMQPTDFFADDHHDRVADAMSEVYENGRARFEADLETSDGVRTPMELTGALLTDADGDPAGCVGTGRDVSRRRERERELERYRRIVETMGDGVYALDESGTYVHVNEYLSTLSGYGREAWETADPADFFRPDDIAAFEDAIRTLLSEDDAAVETVEADLVTADGDAVPIEVNLTLRPMTDGEFRGTVGVVRDITDRRTRERELEQYETIVQTIPDEVYALDAAGRFTSIIPPTDADVTTMGYEPDDLIGEHVSRIMAEDDIETGERLIRDLLADDDRQKASFEMETITESGERVPNENHIALLPMEDGQFRGTVGVLRDVSDRRERERELRRQNERLERFVGVVSHDLRNPLNVAESRLEFAREECDNEHLDHVAESHARMETLIDDLLTLARTGETATDVGPVDLRTVAEACRGAVGGESVTLRVETDRTVVADERRLTRLLENLYRNAVEHGGEDTVTVTIGDCEGGFFVADDGPGIPPDEREDVFESGYTTAAAGTGFGLSIVKEIATAHGWSIEVTESETGGARFEITGVEFA